MDLTSIYSQVRIVSGQEARLLGPFDWVPTPNMQRDVPDPGAASVPSSLQGCQVGKHPDCIVQYSTERYGIITGATCTVITVHTVCTYNPTTTGVCLVAQQHSFHNYRQTNVLLAS